MNKQELINYCNVLKENKSRFINCIDVDRIVDTIKQLDEPKPVKVKQCVADWYKKNKGDFETSLFQCIYELFKKRNDSELSEFENWVIDENTKPFQTLVNMHQFGYEVKEEKRYRISMPKTRNYMNNAQFLCEKDGKIFWCGEWHPFRTKFTRKELEEAGFGWVFDCEGIEIE